MNIFPQTVSASELQRNSAKVIRMAKKSSDPIVVMRNNKPEVAMISMKRLKALIEKETDWETRDALEAIREGEEEFRAGKTFVTTDFSEFLDD